MPNRIVDVSSAQHPGGNPGQGTPIDWAAVAKAGVTTALIKATEGLTYGNPWYGADMAGARAAGIDVLAYHFAGFTADPAKEMGFFVSHAGARWARILDVETSTNVAWMRSFLTALRLDNDQLCTYGSASTLAGIRAQIPGVTWPAAYGQNYPGWGVMWQFTDRSEIPGIPGLVDESSWHGTDLQYEQLFGLNDPPPPTPSQGDDSMFGALALNKQDNFNATLRYLWAMYRTDSLTSEDQNVYWYSYNLPTDKGGFGGSIDPVVGQIIDTAAAKGTLRAQFAGAV